MEEHDSRRSERNAQATFVQNLGDWIATMRWPEGVENGGPLSLVIEPLRPDQPPQGGLSSTVLRQIDFRKAAEMLNQHWLASKRREVVSKSLQKFIANRLRDTLDKGVTDEYLALLAQEYVSAVNRNQAKPNDHLAEMVGKTVSTIRGHLWQARKQGLLTGTPGRAGGQLTPKAQEILKQHARPAKTKD
ncbi:MAG: hypothetical protein ACRC20_10170 [Segniliparus sp.]|uniref:hypothetical protein n=1 Tax=Segniliparus sp. TaxID=2804064 RepID=UPI003F2F249D